ncbi:MAG: RuBisCO large subunit C-terminal-like domain-containing protein [bacterium]|nr:RuBisCO large subunit C-terminal-like domain-containing protein [bacterium]
MSTLNLSYTPKVSDLIVHYTITPRSQLSFLKCVELLAAESGERLRPWVFEVRQEQSRCSIAFPEQLFEAGNISQILSVIAGSIFDTSVAQAVSIERIDWPQTMLAQLPGPRYGLKKVRELLKVDQRPLSCYVFRPQAGLCAQDCLEQAYQAWSGGCDLVQDSPMMTSTELNPFRERLELLSRERKLCRQQSGEEKTYIPNISADTVEEMEDRAKRVREAGLRFVTVNTFQVGFAALSSLSAICAEQELILCGNRSGHGLLTRGNNRLSLPVLSTLVRLLGLEMFPIGHQLSQEVLESSQALQASCAESGQRADRDHPLASFPVCSGALHPGRVEDLIKALGEDLVIQAGEGIASHPYGIKKGAEALQTAIVAASKGRDKKRAASRNDSLKEALRKWDRKPSSLSSLATPSSSRRENDTSLPLEPAPQTATRDSLQI